MKNLYFNSSFKDDKVLEAMNYMPQDEDIIINTYPKSGTTLLQNIVFLLKNEGEYPINFKLYDHVPFIDFQGVECLEKHTRPRLIKSHLPFDKMMFNKNAKYIFVCRNPFDCCASYYHHTKMFTAAHNFYGNFDEYFDVFVEGKVNYGNYFDHLNGWFKERNRPNILFLTYEEVIKDLRGTVKSVGEFSGGAILKNSKDDSIVGKVVEKCSVSSMRAMEGHGAFYPPVPVAEGSNFIRRGVKGDYASIMSKKQVEKLNKIFQKKCGGSGANDIWENEAF